VSFFHKVIEKSVLNLYENKSKFKDMRIRARQTKFLLLMFLCCTYNITYNFWSVCEESHMMKKMMK
jgi:hypothetical protein